MQPFENYIVELLQKRIIINDRYVPVVKHFNEDPILPCITLDLSPGVTTRNIHHEIDETEHLIYHRHAAININVWARDETVRNEICDQILTNYRYDQTFHYSYCSQLQKNNICSTTRNTCPASSNATSGRTIKFKCPNPESYGYESLATKHGIIFDTIVIEPAFDIDEIDKHPPLLHSVMRADAEYMEPYDLGGAQFTGAKYDVTIRKNI